MDPLSVLSLADLEEAAQLLDDAALDLQRKGIAQWEVPCDRQDLGRALAAGQVHGYRDSGGLVGLFCLKPAGLWLPYPVDLPGWYLCRVVVHPARQGARLGYRLVAHAKAMASHRGGSLYLDCWAGNDRLRAFYAKAGFEHLGDFPEDDYRVSAFRFSAAHVEDDS